MVAHHSDPTRPARSRMWWIIAGSVTGLIGLVCALVLGSGRGAPTATPSVPAPSPSVSSAAPTPTPTPSPSPSEPTNWNIDDPASLTVIVNKQRALTPADYVPADLRAVNVPHTWEPQLRDVAATAVESMFQAAQAEAGLALASNSAYRSFAAQQSIYKGDDLSTARPGFSEHQTGLAIDIGSVSGTCSLNTCFADTAEGQWLAQNAWRFGFVLRYPDGQTAVTGYEFEPWHYRYVGLDAASAYHDAGATSLEAFFGLPAAPNY